MKLPALTLHQPWATLVAIGMKRIETRSWGTRYTGPLAIHASQSTEFLDFCHQPVFAVALGFEGLEPDNLPLGEVVAVATLVGCVPTVPPANQFPPPSAKQRRLARDLGVEPTLWEESFGDFSEGRSAWLLAHVRQLSAPIPARGHQRLWEWVVPPPHAFRIEQYTKEMAHATTEVH